MEQARLIDMTKLTDPDNRNCVKKLLAGMTKWRRSKSLRRRWKIDDVTALVNDVLTSSHGGTEKRGRSFDFKSIGDKIASASAYSRQVTEALPRLNDPEGFNQKEMSIALSVFPSMEMSKQVEALAQRLD
jgi:hypothetical protein